MSKPRKSDDLNADKCFQDIVNRKPALKAALKAAEPRIRLAIALTSLRRAAGLTQTQLAAKMGKDQAFVSKMESGSGPTPDTKSIAAFAYACNSGIGLVFTPHAHHLENAAITDAFAISMNEESEVSKKFEEVMLKHNVRLY